jgi:uncharacterized membrane protein
MAATLRDYCPGARRAEGLAAFLRGFRPPAGAAGRRIRDDERSKAMNELALARVLHVLGVVLWIGGVGMVTLTLLPAARRIETPEERLRFFARVEKTFAPQARIWVLLVGLSGLYMLHALHIWARFQSLRYWWMHAMVLVWLFFAAMLFVIEPLNRRRRAARRQPQDVERMFARLQRLHWVVLAVSLVTVAGAVAGSHGYSLFH